ncbi:uncharacterized protein A4U43_C05F12180 [Asparagus officinalis]|uniref:Uncharacterized protein n=1 Tax=Asparagus officinalis TaxID=4686 RepID=A0A5P1EVF8_ASPOF|nr:uncharacterized protein A4U43_C05F12180 [Asparagus officinalis]
MKVVFDRRGDLAKDLALASWVSILEEEEEEQIDYDYDVYFIDTKESVPGGDVGGSFHILDIEAESDIGTANTTPPSVAKHSVVRRLVSIVESFESKEDVLISSIP